MDPTVRASLRTVILWVLQVRSPRAVQLALQLLRGLSDREDREDRQHRVTESQFPRARPAPLLIQLDRPDRRLQLSPSAHRVRADRGVLLVRRKVTRTQLDHKAQADRMGQVLHRTVILLVRPAPLARQVHKARQHRPAQVALSDPRGLQALPDRTVQLHP